MQSLWGIITGVLAWLATKFVIKTVIKGGILLSLTTVVLPSVLYNLIGRLHSESMGYINQKMGESGIDSTVYQLAGIAGWLFNHLQLQTCFTILASALALNFTLSFIRK